MPGECPRPIRGLDCRVALSLSGCATLHQASIPSSETRMVVVGLKTRQGTGCPTLRASSPTCVLRAVQGSAGRWGTRWGMRHPESGSSDALSGIVALGHSVPISLPLACPLGSEHHWADSLGPLWESPSQSAGSGRHLGQEVQPPEGLMPGQTERGAQRARLVNTFLHGFYQP